MSLKRYICLILECEGLAGIMEYVWQISRRELRERCGFPVPTDVYLDLLPL